MISHWWGRFFFGICLSVLLYGCLVNQPQKAENAAAQVTGQPNRLYFPLVVVPPPPGSPPVSNSLYVTSLDSTSIYNQGCALGIRDLNLPGKQDSVVILHFGYPVMVNGQMGANLYYPALPATNDQIAAAVEQFGYGYWFCVGEDFESRLHIGIGTSNYGGSTKSVVTAAHGEAWALMVNKVNDWFRYTCERSCDGQVDAVGANDLELSWNDYATSMDWLTGYGSANKFPLYNFGALPGCPYLASPNAQCGGGGYYWTREQAWMVTYGFNPVFPLPEIYRTDGINAQQWYLMSLYSFTAHGAKMEFIGPMSEYQACLQRGGCKFSGVGIDNTPSQAWTQLYTLLNSDDRTDGEALPFLTDILWLNEPIPAAAQAAAEPPSALSPVGTSLEEGLQQDLQSQQLSAADRANLEEKLRLASQVAAQPARAQSRPGPKSQQQALLAPTQSGANLSTEEAIIEGSEGVVHTWEATIQNLWQGVRNGNYYQVLAGASVDDPQQGLVLVVETSNGNQRSQHYYLTPEKTGKLSIQQVQGTQVFLVDTDGGKWVFDLNTRTFTRQ